MNETIDGDYQTFKSKMAHTYAALRSKYSETAALVADMTDDEIALSSGHDSSNCFAAFNNAKETNVKLTVILAKTVKGYAWVTPKVRTLHTVLRNGHDSMFNTYVIA
ncbi:hypothetical protein O9992_06015 [Vibrio lentus]|nr:hypothetical protein [Vibrio lentus]